MRKFKVGDEFEGVVSDFGMSGEGIVKDGAYPVFVPFAAVGERVRVRIVHAKKDFAFGELIEVLEPLRGMRFAASFAGAAGGSQKVEFAAYAAQDRRD